MYTALSLLLLLPSAPLLQSHSDHPEDPVYEGKPLSRWLADLRSPDVKVRREAARQLRWMKPKPEGTELSLLWALNDRDPDVRVHAAFALANVADASVAAPFLIWALRNNDEKTTLTKGIFASPAVAHRGIAGALAKVGPEVLPYLHQALDEDNRLVRAGAAIALGSFHLPSDATERRRMEGELAKEVPRLCRLLGDQDPYVSECAETGLGGIGPEVPEVVLPALIEALGDPRRRVRAARTLPRLGPTAVGAVPALTKLLNDPGAVKDRAFEEAAEALGQIGGRGGRPAVVALLDALRGGRSTEVRGAAAQALRWVGRDAKDVWAALLEAARSKDEDLRKEARSALLQIDADAARKAGIK